MKLFDMFKKREKINKGEEKSGLQKNEKDIKERLKVNIFKNSRGKETIKLKDEKKGEKIYINHIENLRRNSSKEPLHEGESYMYKAQLMMEGEMLEVYFELPYENMKVMKEELKNNESIEKEMKKVMGQFFASERRKKIIPKQNGYLGKIYIETKKDENTEKETKQIKYNDGEEHVKKFMKAYKEFMKKDKKREDNKEL